MNFSDWLLSELAKRKWSQSDLAKHSKLTKQAIGNYVSGRIPSRDALIVIAKALKIPMDTIFDAVDGKVSKDDAWVEEMNHKLSLLPPSSRGVAEKLLDALLDEGQEPVKPIKSKA